MEHELINIKNAALSLILEARDLKELEEIKLQFLGRSGKLTTTLKEITKVPKREIYSSGYIFEEMQRQ